MFYRLIFLALICCASCIQSHQKASVKGFWKLHSMQQFDSTCNCWKDYRGGMQGYLMYGERHVSLHLQKANYEDYTPHFPNFTDTIPLNALKHLSGNYNYMASYAVNGDVVSHKRFSHSNPADAGKTVQRQFELKGDTLIMSPLEKRLSSIRLKWIRQ